MRKLKMNKEDVSKCVKDFESFLLSNDFINGNETFTYNFRPKVENQDESPAIVTFSEKAYAKIIILLEAFNSEIAWHGVANRVSKGNYYIEDILVYPQFVTGVNVKTDPLELAGWAQTIPTEVYNNISFQGHSHVNMSVKPSSVDLDDQKKYLKQLNEDEFYIFAIFNKKYETNFSIYDLKYDIFYEDKDIEYNVEGEDLGEFLDEAKCIVKRHYISHGDLDSYYDSITDEYYDEKYEQEEDDGLQ